jgi:signal transduction histidine kinase
VTDLDADGGALNVLVVEDNPTDVLIARETLSTSVPKAFELYEASSLRDAFSVASCNPIDVAMLDLGLPDSMGLDTFSTFNARFPGIPTVVVTGLQDDGMGLTAVKLGAQDFLPKRHITATLLPRTLTYAVERKRAELELRLSQERLRQFNETLEQRVSERTDQLRAMAVELTRSEERERRRLAQILHDHLQQLLVAAKLNLSFAQEQFGDAALNEHLSRIDSLLARSLDASRSLTADLSPPLLYERGFDAAVHWLARRSRETYGLDVKVVAKPIPQPDEDVRAFLFQAIRELILNIVKHAGVQQARIDLAASDDGQQLSVTVADRGRGFDATGAMRPTDEGGYGLFSIRERLKLIGGRMDIDSRNGHTQIRLLVPLAATPRPEAMPLRRPAAGARKEVQRRANTRRGGEPGVVHVLLVDDHKIVREGIAQLLQSQPGIMIVGEAADGKEAVDLALELRPDAIVMDVTMPRLDGVDATRQIVAALPEVRIIALSTHEERDMSTAMIEAGAVAYLTKGGRADDLVAAVLQR